MMVVFDLDDTLYKEADYVASGCQAVAKTIASRHPLLSTTELLETINSCASVADGFDALIAAVNNKYHNSLNIKDILTIYRTHFPDIHLDNVTEETLQNIVNQGFKLGLISDGRITAQMAKIRALGLNQYISEHNILISEAIGADKHFSLPFELMMRRNPSERQFVYIGDNPEKDFLWPNKLGWLTVMLLDKDKKNIHPQDFQNVNPYAAQFKISSLSELPQLLHKGDYVK